MGFGWTPIIWLVGHNNNTRSFLASKTVRRTLEKRPQQTCVLPCIERYLQYPCILWHDTADITEHWSASVLMVVNLITHKDGRYVTRSIFCLLSSAYVTIMPQLHYLHHLYKGLREYSSWIFYIVSHLCQLILLMSSDPIQIWFI